MRALTYAIGDVHGRADLLSRAIGEARRHGAGRDFGFVFLGDYIDRGPDSRATIELLIRLQRGGGIVCLKGNHEAMLTRYDEGRSPDDLRIWLDHGGAATLASYGGSPDDPAAINQVPPAHRLWMKLRPTVLSGARIFVHAGINPRNDVNDQGEKEFLWIREAFLKAPAKRFVDPRHVVHGHTPVWRGKPCAERPELLQHRTNLDTGAHETGVLTVAAFDALGCGPPVDLLPIRAKG